MHTAKEVARYVKEKLKARQEEKRDGICERKKKKKKIDSVIACVVAEVQLLGVSSQ